MRTYSVREVVEMALQTERLGYQLYKKLEKKFMEQEMLQELFSYLAEEEQKHEVVFAGLLGKVKDGEPEGWEEAQPYFRAIVESEFFLGSGKALPSLDHVLSPLDAVNYALGFEKETALFFNGLKRAVGEQEIVEDIIKEEARHISRLMSYRENLEG